MPTLENVQWRHLMLSVAIVEARAICGNPVAQGVGTTVNKT